MIPHGFYAFFTETSSNTLSKCTLVSEDQIPKSKYSLRVITFEIGPTKGYSLINLFSLNCRWRPYIGSFTKLQKLFCLIFGHLLRESSQTLCHTAILDKRMRLGYNREGFNSLVWSYMIGTIVGSGDWRFDNLSGSQHQRQVNSCCQSNVLGTVCINWLVIFAVMLSAGRLKWRRLVMIGRSWSVSEVRSFCSVRL